MKGIMVLYICMVMFITIAQNYGYTGAHYTGFNATDVEGQLSSLSYQVQNESDWIEPLKASAGFLDDFITIVIKSLTFRFVIDGAPDVVNYFIRTVMFAMSWAAFYDFIIVIIGAIAGVLGRLL